MIELSLNITD
jgi:hypothetical protein